MVAQRPRLHLLLLGCLTAALKPALGPARTSATALHMTSTMSATALPTGLSKLATALAGLPDDKYRARRRAKTALSTR